MVDKSRECKSKKSMSNAKTTKRTKVFNKNAVTLWETPFFSLSDPKKDEGLSLMSNSVSKYVITAHLETSGRAFKRKKSKNTNVASHDAAESASFLLAMSNMYPF